jgi:hypothetical protein
MNQACDVFRKRRVFASENRHSFYHLIELPGEFHMTHKFILLLVATIFGLCAVSLSAGEQATQAVQDKIVIALQTDDFELAETDISDLEIGDAETIYTESGETIDLLRTAEGIEIYVDGELLEMGLHDEDGHHEAHHIVHMDVEVECESDEECEHGMGSLHGEDHHAQVIIIEKNEETY